MISIAVKKIKIHNFKSYTDETFSFPKSEGLKLLSGDNKVEPRLGANGGGKSSLWDALEWCFHGSSVRGGKTSSIVTWGEKETEVIIEVLIGKELNVIKRYGPPMKIELNANPATQDQIDILLGLSRPRFLNSVIFGQGTTLFPDLPIPERGALLDEVLNLRVWQAASDSATKQYSSLEKELTDITKGIAFVEGQLTSLPSEESLKKKINEWDKNQISQLDKLDDLSVKWEEEEGIRVNNLDKARDQWDKDHEEKLLQVATKLEELEAELAPLQFNAEQPAETFDAQIFGIEKKLRDLNDKKYSLYREQSKVTHEIDAVKGSKGLWERDTCPTCSQSITESKKIHELDCIHKVLAALVPKQKTFAADLEKLDKEIYSADKEKSDYNITVTREKEKKKFQQREVTRIEFEIKAVEKAAKMILAETNSYLSADRAKNPYLNQVQDLKKQVNPFLADEKTIKASRGLLINQYAAEVSKQQTIQSKMTSVEYWKHGFKRIRLYFVQQILSTLQIEIQSAASALGLDGWQISLATEAETKTQTIKLGVQIHIKSPVSEGAWECWSGGETQRLRLAIAMGLASLIQRASGVIYDFEVWDEPTKGLSPQGVEDLLEALRYRSEILNKQVWLTDHSALTYSGFSEIWSAVKDTNGTKLVKLND